MIPKVYWSKHSSWLKMAIPAEGVDAIKTFVVDCSRQAAKAVRSPSAAAGRRAAAFASLGVK